MFIGFNICLHIFAPNNFLHSRIFSLEKTMTKEDALQKVNDYCSEKSYTSATLTDGFKDKFAEHFAKRYPDAQADDETAIADMKFALNSAFSGASAIITEKTTAFTSKENDYKKQIEELTKKLGIPPTPPTPPTPPATPEIPDEIKQQLAELKQFKAEETKQKRRAAILAIAKKEVDAQYHKSFETFVEDYDIDLEKEDKEQADKWISRYRDVMKDSVGDIKPLAPQVRQQMDDARISQIKEYKL